MFETQLSPAVVATRQKQRGGVIMNVRKELTKGEETLKADSFDCKTLQVISVKLRDYRKRIEEYSSEIQDSLTDEAQDADIQKVSEIEDEIMEMLANIKATIEISKEDAAAARSEMNASRTETLDVSRVSSNGASHNRIRLPKINLMEYDGDPMKWGEFWDYFDITFHSNDDIPIIEKFSYLRSLVTDDALDAIRGYRLTASNYEEVIKVMKQRFGDPEIAIFHHFDSMLTMPPSSGDVSELQKVFDNCETHIRSLIALGLGEETFGRVFVPILLSKLPGNVRVELIRRKGREPWSLAKLRELLRDELYARDMSKRSFGGSKQTNGNGKSSGSNSSKKSEFTASALPNAENASLEKRPPFCHFCKGQHYPNQCTEYETVEERKGQIPGACLICLQTHHSTKQCKRRHPCFFCKSMSHHQALCEKTFSTKKANEKSTGRTTQMNIGATDQVSEEKSVTASILSHDGQRGVLQTAVADVSGNTATVEVRHMLDNGSDNSFISSDVAKKIGARCIGQETISLAGFSDSKRRQRTYKIYEFELVLRGGKRLSIKAYGTDVIICSIDKLAFDTKKFPVLTRLPLAEQLVAKNEHVNVDVLIGSDYYYEIVNTERIPLDDGLMLLDSKLGYIIAGRVVTKSQTTVSMLLSKSPMPDSNFDLERFWKLEEIGVKEPLNTTDDEVALSHFNKTIQFNKIESRYMVKWPYKVDSPPLPDNYALSYGRLKGVVARCNATPDLMDKYDSIFKSQLEMNIIEEAPDIPDGQIHYLPHHAVITPNKTTTKVRVVYDASSKASKLQPSLNDCVYRGPVMLESLCGLLLRFRIRAIGVASDIEKAFLQVGLQKEDRDVTRFLWLRDVKLPCTKDNVIHYRFRRVCFGVLSSPFLLGGTVYFHLHKVGTPVADRILKSLYVDNVIDSIESLEEALAYYTEARQIFDEASMNLREWFSNSPELMAAIPEKNRGCGSKTKILGLLWDLEADTISCPVGSLDCTKVVTKRVVLHTIAKVFDPCGFFTPITSPAKWLMQELWQRKFEWDTPLDEELLERWKSILQNLQRVSQYTLPRCCGPFVGAQTLQLHAFCDASAKAYCAAIYIVAVFDKVSMASLVFSKCRVSPLQEQTIPRLELLAATIGARLLEFVSKELRLPIKSKFLWSDSQCVLHWLTGKPVSTIFVRNRVNEIRKHQDVVFRYVPTADNPADLPTRGIKDDDFQQCNLWWHGPHWLTEPDSWPDNPVPVNHVSNNLSEVEELGTAESTTLITTADDKRYPFDINRYSKYSKVIRITGWILRFINNVRLSQNNGHKMTLRSGRTRSSVNDAASQPSWLTANELEKAKLVWEQAVQLHHFPDIVTSGVTSVKEKKSLGSLFLNSDRVICCQGRLANADLADCASTPKLLPKNDRYTELLIQDYHERFNHAKVKQTLAELRCEYWVVHGRATVKRVIRQCPPCRRQKGGSFGVPPPPDLPDFRVRKSSPFSTIGIDYLGPLLIFSNDGSSNKVWICLFTCAVTRAIHLEVVTQLDTENFLLCLRRFMSFYGCPELIVSDNAGQFILSQRVLKKLWQEVVGSKDVQDFSAGRGISWKFITESAPWMGGFYERMVGTVKNSLKAVFDRRKLNLIELQTVVYEVTAVVNSRPLVYSEDEAGDIAITPAHLIMRHRSISPFLSVGEPMDSPSSSYDKVVASWKRLRNLVDSFWEVWQKQYLLSLRERNHSDKQRNVVRAIPQIGQVVLVEEKSLPRSQWRIGRISEHIFSADEQIRSVKLVLTTGKTMSRPIKKLYPLEIPNTNNSVRAESN